MRSLEPLSGPRSAPGRTTLRALLAAGTLLVLLASSLPAQAQWKWRDASGRITVSDRPPPREVADKDILQRPLQAQRREVDAALAAAAASAASAPTAPGAAGPATPSVDKDLEARKRAAEAEKAAKAKAEEDKLAARRADNCRRARSNLATLESGQRLARVNDKGEREIIDDKTRAADMQSAREAIASECR